MSSTANKEEKKRWLQSVLICVENLLLEMKKIFPVVTEKISFIYQTDFDILDQDEVCVHFSIKFSCYLYKKM